MEQATRLQKRINIGYSRQMITAMISEYEKGERTIKEYCSDKGIKRTTFYYWLSKQKNNNQQKPAPAFVPVTIKDNQLEEKVFAEYKEYGEGLGFRAVFAGPLVRSSYMADLVHEQAR